VASRSKYHPFNRFLRKIESSAKEVPGRVRPKYVDPKIDADYLQKVFEEQNGKCYWTGLPLNIELKTGRLAMSIDRINQEKDYVIGNLCFTFVFFNIGRGSASIEDTIEVIKYLSRMPNNPNLKNYKITNKPGVNMDKYPPILMESILYGATSGNKEGVTALVNQYSNNAAIDKPKKRSNSAAYDKKKNYFENSTLILTDAENEPTQSVYNIMVDTGRDKKGATMARFYSSKVATDLMNKGAVMIDTQVGTDPNRYHFKLSDLN